MTDRRKRPHPALGARWVSAGMAVAATVGITGYLEVDSLLPDVAATAEVRSPPLQPVPAVAPVTPVTAAPTTSTVVPEAGPVTAPPPPLVTIETVPPYVPRTSVPPTHARTRGSNG